MAERSYKTIDDIPAVEREIAIDYLKGFRSCANGQTFYAYREWLILSKEKEEFLLKNKYMEYPSGLISNDNGSFIAVHFTDKAAVVFSYLRQLRIDSK